MNYGIVLCSSQFGCEAYTFSERQSICALYNVQVHWPFQSMTNSHRFEYFYLERRIEATYRSNAHYYTENRIDMTSNRSDRSTLWWGCDKVRLIRMKRKIEKDRKRGEWLGLYVCVCACVVSHSKWYRESSIKLMVGLRRVSTLIGLRPISCDSFMGVLAKSGRIMWFRVGFVLILHSHTHANAYASCYLKRVGHSHGRNKIRTKTCIKYHLKNAIVYFSLFLFE